MRSIARSARAGVATILLALPLMAAAYTPYQVEAYTNPAYAHLQLWDINNHGDLVGQSHQQADGPGRAIAIIGGVAQDVPITNPDLYSSGATGISDGGVVVGSFIVRRGTDSNGNPILSGNVGFIYDPVTNLSSSWLWSGADHTFLRGISPDGVWISGYGQGGVAGPGRGFVYNRVTQDWLFTDAPGTGFNIMQGINASHMAVGSDLFFGPSPRRPGVMFDAGTGIRTEVDLAGAAQTSLRGIDDSGVLAGWFRTSFNGASTAFVGGLTDFTVLQLAGATSTFGEGINNAGWVVGNADLADGTRVAFLARPVPEPGTWALMGLGLAAVASLRRRSQRRA